MQKTFTQSRGFEFATHGVVAGDGTLTAVQHPDHQRPPLALGLLREIELARWPLVGAGVVMSSRCSELPRLVYEHFALPTGAWQNQTDAAAWRSGLRPIKDALIDR